VPSGTPELFLGFYKNPLSAHVKSRFFIRARLPSRSSFRMTDVTE
jgi:hypothetical protein